MKIHILSDLHIEAWDYSPEEVDADITVLAGDIFHKAQAAQWALENIKGPIVLVAGNHEFYWTNFQQGLEKMRAVAKGSRGRLYFLERDSVIIDGVRFLGATGWSDFQLRGSAPLAMLDSLNCLMDYRAIQVNEGFADWSPEYSLNEATLNKNWIFKELLNEFEGKTVLVTHHAISEKSLDPARPPGLLDGSFANNWEYLTGDGLDLVIHGHTHYACDYMLNGTRVISNPRGYPGEIVDFNPRLIVSI